MMETSNGSAGMVGRTRTTFREDFIRGMRQSPKMIPPKYFYDGRGSHLFEMICRLEEYYPTRTERAILARIGRTLRELVGPSCRLVELGSGASEKTELVLDALEGPACYVPIDISGDALDAAAKRLRGNFPDLEVHPVCHDYSDGLDLPEAPGSWLRTVFFYPGSTLGNFTPDEALRFLASVGDRAVAGDGLLVGVALQTDKAVLEAAYNDDLGVTAAFNLNLLRRARHELGARFDPTAFRHEAAYNERHQRIEMWLVSECWQVIRLGRERFTMDRGEKILTEYSYKFTDERLAEIASGAGFRSVQAWRDAEDRFSVHYFEKIKGGAAR